jgi:eukaryotic-like serine/threonine-protein kinase
MSINPGNIGKYELQERLVSGTVGEIWKAFDTQQRYYVAIKIIPINAQTGTDFTSRFYREAGVLATLRHPNIVPVQDFRVAQSESEAYIIMDYIEGPSLADYLGATAHTGTIPPPAEIIRLLAPIAGALDYAHQRNVIHGALKPTVILLGKDGATSLSPGEPKITDFGFNYIQNPLALSLNDVSYISPEIAQGFAGTSRSDLYSLGVILYEMCTGALPFNGETPGDILMQHIHGSPTSPVLINPHIPPALTAVIMRSLARDPVARPPTATALVTLVAKALNTSMPESISRSRSSLGIVDPPSLSGISGSLDTMNSPTFLSQLSQQSLSKASSVPPVVAGTNTPALPPSPVISSSTPVLPVTQAGSIPGIQTSEEKYIATSQISQPTQAASASTPIPATPKGPSVTPQAAGQIAPPPAPVRRPGWFYIALVAVLLVVLAGSAFGVYLFNTRSTPPTQSTVVGHVFFMSSGFLGSNSNLSSAQGITDELVINLQNLSNPQPGKVYYAWLLDENQTNLPAVALGSLHLTRGQVSMTYKDPLHNNLLANYGHFLVTEEDASPSPISPSLDPTTWRYSAAFPITPNPADTVNHFSLLDHLRHLLARDPKLKAVGLGGGLDIWLFRNVTKVVEQAGSARDAQKLCASGDNAECDFLHRALVRVLDYLDGSTYVQADVPPNTQVLIDQTIARVALLEFDPVHQQPPGYLDHIGTHLRELASSPGVTAQQRALAIRIGQATNNVQVWLEAVHTDAKQLVNMNNSQLSQLAALSLLDDMLTQAKNALVGQFDPNTNMVKEGVAQIHDNIQGLATFDLKPCTITNGKNSCS